MSSRKSRFNRQKGLNRKEKKQVRALVRQPKELKHKQTTDTDSSLTAASGFNLEIGSLAVAQGLDNDERIGDNIEMKYVHFKCAVNSGTADGLVRAFVIQDLENVSPTGIGINFPLPNDFYPDQQVANAKYKILFDSMIKLSAASNPNHLFNIRIPAKKMVIKKLHYDDAGSTLSGGGNVRLFLTTLNTTASQITVDCNVKMAYYDD